MKVRPLQAVIYAITNTLNGKQYIGQTSNFRARWKLHRRLLKRGVHHCAHLQHAWNKYGPEAFAFIIVEYVDDRTQLTAREQAWFDATPDRYNTAPAAGTPLGITLSAETRLRQSRAARAQWQKPGERERRSLAMHGSRVVTAEQRAQMSRQRRGKKLALTDSQRAIKRVRAQVQWLKPGISGRQSLMRLGKPLSPEHQAKIVELNRQKAKSPEFRAKLRAAWQRRRITKVVSPITGPTELLEKPVSSTSKRTMLPGTKLKLLNANLGRRRGPQTPEHRAKIAAALRGRAVSAETRAKQSAARKGRALSAEHREKCRIASTGKKHSPETRQKIAEANRQRVWSPESRKKMGEIKRNQKRSPEAIAKQRASIKAFYERKRATQEGE
jgi:group I intron endonuclease